MHSEEEQQNLRLARGYLELFNSPATTKEEVQAFLDEGIVWREMPNRFAPAGRTSDYQAMSASWEKGREYLPEQTYTLRHIIANGETVALEISWIGKMKKALGPFAANTQLSAQIAIFLRFRDGKIVSQTDYPCYDPVIETEANK